ncbi:MAG TPA: hypothetical protein PK581_08205 [Caldisericia bacterium]|jgi:hypothetical protein|nr:hypothetical protein [Caldisericia bacterium]
MKKISFWGVLLLAIGFLWLLNEVFKLELAFWSIVIAPLLILLGVHILLKSKRSTSTFSVQIDPPDFSSSTDHQSSFLFSSKELNLSQWASIKENKNYRLETIFSEAVCWLDPRYSWNIKASTVFGQTNFPDHGSLNFGDQIYQSKGWGEDPETKNLVTNVVFAKLDLRFLPTSEGANTQESPL